jgi:hypothetical protein
MHRFETATDPVEVRIRVEAMALIADRRAAEDERRILTAIRNGLDLPYDTVGFSGLVHLALRLPAPSACEALRFAATRLPPDNEIVVRGLEAMRKRVQVGEAQKVLAELKQMNSTNGTWGTVAFSTFAK